MGLLRQLSGYKLVGLITAALIVAATIILARAISVDAFNVRTEIKAIPSGIAKVIDNKGKPPGGFHMNVSNKPTALTINTDIEYGTVFPGESHQGEFKVMLTDPELGGQYTRVEYHLILASEGGYLDLTPYLTVERDPAEEDTESDNVTYASVDSSDDDNSDRWLVTFDVPDDITNGDYWTTITVWVDQTFNGNGD
jgi:hypothetical protein